MFYNSLSPTAKEMVGYNGFSPTKLYRLRRKKMVGYFGYQWYIGYNTLSATIPYRLRQKKAFKFCSGS